MATRFDNEQEPNEFMDMPCQCDCGNWFDLNDGYPHENKIVCKDCDEKNQEVADLRERYRELDYSDKPYKREKTKILKSLKALGEELE